MEKYGGNKMFKPLKLVDAQELLLTPLDDPGFIVEDLIPGGVTVIAGDEKSGKSYVIYFLILCSNRSISNPMHYFACLT